MKKILTAAVIVILAAGCWGSKNAELGPKETLEAFYMALFSGDFNEAESLCGTSGMKACIEKYKNVWAQADSTVISIVPAILSEAAIEITDIVKNAQDRTVFYKLTSADGKTLEKIATLRNDERGWEITEITDRH